MANRVFQEVMEILLRQFEVSREDITLDTSLYEDLNADSLDAVQICLALEEHFWLDDIPEEKLLVMRTVRDIVEYVEKNIAVKE